MTATICSLDIPATFSLKISDGDGPKIDLVGHDIDDFVNMIEKLGANWPTTGSRIPDLLDDHITDWDSIQGPPTLFPESNLRVVK